MGLPAAPEARDASATCGQPVSLDSCRHPGPARPSGWIVTDLALGVTLLAALVATAEQASALASSGRRLAGRIDAGNFHTCAIGDDDTVRCWGSGHLGQLGYGNTNDIGDDETPGTVVQVDLGAGRTAKDIAAGDFHTCASFDDGSVRCWGFGRDGRLGDANTDWIGNDELPGAIGPVDIGTRRKTAITAGGYHTCAVLDNGRVRCWGSNGTGQLGYGNVITVGDTETPRAMGPVVPGGPVQGVYSYTSGCPGRHGLLHGCGLDAGGGDV